MLQSREIDFLAPETINSSLKSLVVKLTHAASLDSGFTLDIKEIRSIPLLIEKLGIIIPPEEKSKTIRAEARFWNFAKVQMRHRSLELISALAEEYDRAGYKDISNHLLSLSEALGTRNNQTITMPVLQVEKLFSEAESISTEIETGILVDEEALDDIRIEIEDKLEDALAKRGDIKTVTAIINQDLLEKIHFLLNNSNRYLLDIQALDPYRDLIGSVIIYCKTKESAYMATSVFMYLSPSSVRIPLSFFVYKIKEHVKKETDSRRLDICNGIEFALEQHGIYYMDVVNDVTRKKSDEVIPKVDLPAIVVQITMIRLAGGDDPTNADQLIYSKTLKLMQDVKAWHRYPMAISDMLLEMIPEDCVKTREMLSTRAWAAIEV